MLRLAALLAGIVTAGALGMPAQAIADPADHVPYCSGDQTPMNSNCRVTPVQISVGDGHPGANPQLPLGVGNGEPLTVGQG